MISKLSFFSASSSNKSNNTSPTTTAKPVVMDCLNIVAQSNNMVNNTRNGKSKNNNNYSHDKMLSPSLSVKKDAALSVNQKQANNSRIIQYHQSLNSISPINHQTKGTNQIRQIVISPFSHTYEEVPENSSEVKSGDSVIVQRIETADTMPPLGGESVVQDESIIEEVEEEVEMGPAPKSPDHHARRPMNAFLIFCKRHRAIVREKYPNLENRAITKILGDWWANLEKVEKEPFKNLASEYKDAFLSANPNFKWYKLPAPPLRILGTRPTNGDISFSDMLNVNSYCGGGGGGGGGQRGREENEFEGDDVYESRSESRHSAKSLLSTGISGNKWTGFFKLADEKQMGGLNDLMVMHGGGNSSIGGADLTVCDKNNNRKDDIEMNHNDDTFSTNLMKKSLAESNGNASPNKKRRILSMGEEEEPPKSGRACKGKKYLEFIKHTKTSASSSVLSPGAQNVGQNRTKPIGFPHNAYCKQPPISNNHHDDFNNGEAQMDSIEVIPKQESGDKSENFGNKLFDASVFALDGKINALPALSLESYLIRKKAHKKKKIIGKGKHSAKKVQPTIQEVKEQMQKAMVGSQKRKARKESITRRDINSMTENNVDTSTHTSDLLILATLAEMQQ